MRIVIVGGGEVGFGLASTLAARHEVVVIDQNADSADRFEQRDVEFRTGAGTSADVLTGAGISRAALFVAGADLDKVNLVACGIANPLGAPQTICFVS
ncbi:MAG: NAD-binding protein [Vicinamibacterales bacterium]